MLSEVIEAYKVARLVKRLAFGTYLTDKSCFNDQRNHNGTRESLNKKCANAIPWIGVRQAKALRYVDSECRRKSRSIQNVKGGQPWLF
jgi:hypothetical protein